VPIKDAGKYGMLLAREVERGLYRVEDMIEKPAVEAAPSDLAIMGRYVLTPQLFGCLERTTRGSGGEYQLTDGLRLLLAEQPIYALEYRGRRYDCGSKLGYLQATVELALARPDLADAVRAVVRDLIGPTSIATQAASRAGSEGPARAAP
jgi:UTP--glucose-1-phosphate uridylyltransferase